MTRTNLPPKPPKSPKSEEPGPFQPNYPSIEKLVASEDFREIDKNLGAAHQALEKISKEGGLGKARDARKAMKAIEKVKDLLAELVRLKRQSLSGDSGPQVKK